MKRRDFLGALGGAAAAWPVVVRAEATGPTIGYLSSLSEAQAAAQLNAFRRGLRETGLVEDRNVFLEYRWADGQYQRLPAMAAELVAKPVSLILGQAPPAALAARAVTTTIPIVFVVGFDPVEGKLVQSLSRPGGNATGMTLLSPALGPKRLEMLRDLAPKATVVAILVNPVSPDSAPEIGPVQSAAQAMGLRLVTFNASNIGEVETAFTTIAALRPDAMLVASDPFFLNIRSDIVARAARLRIPAIYPFRDFAVAGGLISYGTNIANSYRQAGIYAGRILKGATPADLPVMQPTLFEMVINLKTAEALGIDIPPALHARSDEVIE
jgi:putative ABC transport system substrate-binding protein